MSALTLGDYFKLIRIHGEVLPLIPKKDLLFFILRVTNLFWPHVVDEIGNSLELEFLPQIRREMLTQLYYSESIRIDPNQVKYMELHTKLVDTIKRGKCNIGNIISFALDLGQFHALYSLSKRSEIYPMLPYKEEYYLAKKYLDIPIIFTNDQQDEFFSLLSSLRL